MPVQFFTGVDLNIIKKEYAEWEEKFLDYKFKSAASQRIAAPSVPLPPIALATTLQMIETEYYDAVSTLRKKCIWYCIMVTHN